MGKKVDPKINPAIGRLESRKLSIVDCLIALNRIVMVSMEKVVLLLNPNPDFLEFDLSTHELRSSLHHGGTRKIRDEPTIPGDENPSICSCDSGHLFLKYDTNGDTQRST